MKLKALLLTKFLNKYTAIGKTAPGLAEYIQEELDNMFVGEKFDERDLVKIDRRVRMYIKQKRMENMSMTVDPKLKNHVLSPLNSDRIKKSSSVAKSGMVSPRIDEPI